MYDLNSFILEVECMLYVVVMGEYQVSQHFMMYAVCVGFGELSERICIYHVKSLF
jgi:hypothetical protein